MTDLPILTKAASKITTNRGNGHTKGTGVEVPEGFLFDWVWVCGAGFAIDEGVEGSLLVFANSTVPEFAVGYLASAPTQMATDFVVFQC
jgi:hypothetical protein